VSLTVFSAPIGTVSSVYDVCRCAHKRAAHEHHRAGSDCALCPPGVCHHYRSATPIRGLIARLFGKSRAESLRDHVSPPLNNLDASA
jgi:hypothetical protein